MKKMLRLVVVLAGGTVLILGVFILLLSESSSAWFLKTFGEMDFSVVVYQLFSPMEGTSAGILRDYAQACLYPSAVRTLFLAGCYIFWRVVTGKISINMGIRFPGRKWDLRITPARARRIGHTGIVICIIPLLCSVMMKAKQMGVPAYLREISQKSALFEEYYVDPRDVALVFPKQKRNLILLYLESMESTYASVSEGGAKTDNYIPELTLLAKENLNFSDHTGLGGAHNYAGGWTMAGLLASSSGVPYKLPVEGNSSGEYETFLPGLTTLGDILKEEGYRNYFMCGSDAVFGGRKAFYEQHGEYEILDYAQAIAHGIIPPEYHEYWGMEDEKLYAFARDQLTEIAQNEEPFNFALLTVDTHHPDGYACGLCQNQYGDQFADAIACASRQAYDFVMWCSRQEWYEDTTIIITGDHLSMNNTFWDDIGDYDRNVYNCFINIPEGLVPVRIKNREFSAVDLFPTILAAMGTEIEGNRLGLGTNLFSDEATLPEALGRERFTEELKLYSNYYFVNFVIE